MNDNINLPEVSFELLVLNTSFKEWVEQSNRESIAYWDGWIMENSGYEEVVKQARAFLLEMQNQRNVLPFETVDLEVDALLKKVGVGSMDVGGVGAGLPKEGPAVIRKMFKWRAVAAVVVFLLTGAAFLIIRKMFDDKELAQVTQRGERSRLELPDGSTVILDVDSRLDYPRKFSGGQRVVELKGEAMFDVKRDESRPFVIKAGPIDVQVLGTTFNISTYADEEKTRVELLSGAVMVRLNDKDSNVVALRPFEKLIYDKPTRQWKVERFETEDVVSWKDGTLYFDNTSIDEIVKDLERWFDIKITIENPANKPAFYNGKFKTASLDKVLDGLCFTWNAAYEVKGRNVTIRFR